ncbi:lysophospholipid acyltransferase 1 isoform X9 [Pipistrellus kuhlii]|uniref:lysophospholipid acyltransferase 1 isoform X9 n=1 Tax=Pipistrellus kuhlii TaxID=59472 RepID=UPI001E26FA05|nr:lysophospholipid acyltransferase 1 isoform X9 [Pipistrellus kuhlii]
MGAERREREAARWARPSPGAPAAAPTLSLRPGSGGPSASPLGPGRESVASPSEQPPTGARTGGRGAAAACGSGQPPPEDAGWQPRRRPASPTAPPAPPACTRSAGAWASRWTRYSAHLFVLVLMCYGILVTASVSNIHRYSFFVAMGYLTICHISRIYIFHYGILTTDFSGPLMIVTQKITTLAFQVHDGLGRRAEDLSAEQHRLAVKVKPSFLEYLSYLLNFMSVIAGPCNNFKDYIAFIEGRHIHMKLLEVNWKEKGFHSLPEPSPMTATSFKMYLGNWNIQTATWLKRVCYERVPWYPTVFTFILSALWHGVYPGYYFTFLTGILVTVAARTVRNNCRHYFLSSKALKVAYDVATWAATQLAVSYTVAPFVMLAVEPTINLYKSMYFYLHIVSLLIILFLPVRPQAHTQRQPWNSVNRKKTD